MNKTNNSKRGLSILKAVFVLILTTVPLKWANAQLNLQMKQPTLSKVAERIKTQSNYQFFYEDKMAGMTLNDVKVKGADIQSLLNQLFQGKGITYKIVGDIIYLSDEKTAAQNLNKPKYILKGKVTDVTGSPLIGVGIQSATDGVTTDLDGNYSISTTEGEMLVFSYIGFASKAVKATGSVLNLVLQENTELLDGVVVTALGIKREEKALSYNVQKIDNEKLTSIKDANFINSISGKVAGVVVNSSSAGAGAAARVVMRGTKSLEKDDNALYVIDGIPMFNINSGNNAGGTMSSQPGTSSVADINPEDVENMTVLTGPSAAALYGSEAANGVILITTKKGSEGKARVTYSNNTTFSNPLMMPRFQNTYGNKEGSSDSWGGQKLANPSSYNPADFFNTGVTEINAVTFTVGNTNNQTYASVSTTNSKGILPNNAYNRYNFSIRNTAKFLDNKMTFDVGAQYIIQDNKNMVGSGAYFNPLASLYLFPRGENFQEVQMFERFDEGRAIMTQYWPNSIYSTDMSMQNPYWIMHRMVNTMNKRRYMFNASLKYEITDWLNIAGRIRVDNSDFDSYDKRYATTNPTFTEGSNKGFYGHAKQNDRTVYGDIIASISKNFVDDKLSMNINLGASINDQKEDLMSISGGLDKLPNFFHVGNIAINKAKRNEKAWHDQTQSIFASAEFGWDRWIYLTLTGRNDWASQLAFTSKKSYFYPSVGLSFILTELVKLPEPISYVKVRGSWAEVASAPARYLTRMQYNYNDKDNIYEFPKDHYNTDLKPENTKSWEFGLNTKFFKNRVNFDLTWYKSNTFNQTFKVEASKSSGYAYNLVQTGNISNSGIELGLGYSDSWGDFRFSTNFTYTFNENRIVKLANGAINPETKELIKMDYYSKGTLGIIGGPTIRLTEGGTMGDLYINQRLRQSPNGYIWMKDGKVELETTGYKKIGSLLPKHHLGWSGNFGWRGLNFGFVFTGRVGGLVVSDTQAMLDKYGVSETTAKAREKGFVPLGDLSADVENYYSTISSAPGTYYTYSATNFRLSELSLSYALPKKWFANKVGMTLGITGKNLWMIYCKAPFDPESTSSVTSNFYQGVDYFQQPSLRGIGFNVKLSF